MAIKNGVYEIYSTQVNNLLWDVSGENPADGTRIQLYTKNTGGTGTGNHQKFIVFQVPEEPGQYLITTGINPYRAYQDVEYRSDTPVSNATVAQQIKAGKNSGRWPYIQMMHNVHMTNRKAHIYNQRWMLQQTDYEGKECYYVISVGANKYTIDVADGRTSQNGGRYTFLAGDSLVLWAKDASDKKEQKFEFVPTYLVDKNLGNVKSVGMEFDPYGSYFRDTLIFNGWGAAEDKIGYFSWFGSSPVQLKYQIRKRIQGSDTWTDWSSWMNVNHQPVSNDWGGTSVFDLLNFTDENHRNQWMADPIKRTFGSHTLSFADMNNPGTYDAAQVNIGIRKTGTYSQIIEYLSDEGGQLENAHYHAQYIDLPVAGLDLWKTVNVYWQPTLTIDSFAFTPKGVMIGYTSDLKQNNNQSLYVSKIDGLTSKDVNRTGVNYSGTITIPMRELTHVPENGEKFYFSAKLVSVDGIEAQGGSESRAISYNANHNLNVDGTFEYIEDAAVIKLRPNSQYPEMECHIIYKQDGETLISECPLQGDGTFLIVPPFDKEYTVMLSAIASDDSWGVRSWAGQIIHGEGHMFNFGYDYFRLFLQENPYSGPSGSYTADSQSYTLQGDRRESVFFGEGAQVSQSISGLVPIDQTKPLDGASHPYPANCSLEDFHRLRLAKYAVYRDLYGRRYDVAIVSTNESPYMENIFNVSISMKERE